LNLQRQEIAMTTSAIFIPLPGFTWVSRGRSVEVQFCDKGEEFRNCAEECQEIANRWGGELRRQYEDLSRQWLVLARLADQRRPPSG
jgi:hypothetical protein